MIIRTEGLTKRYGETIALDGVDIAVPEGSIFGLVGANGAGKTTLLGILAGLRQASAGTVEIAAPRRAIATLPDTPRFDPWLTGREVVSLAQHLAGRSDADVDGTISGVGLSDAAHRPVGGYSRGMLQRLGIACTVVGQPAVLLLDEPASALDPLGRREVLDLISRLRGSATVLLSSHILGDVQEVCDTVGILRDGRLVFQGPIQDLLVGSAVPRLVVRLRPPIEPVAQAVAAQPWVTGVERLSADQLAVAVTSVAAAERMLAGALDAAGAHVVSFGPEAASLERAFLEVAE